MHLYFSLYRQQLCVATAGFHHSRKSRPISNQAAKQTVSADVHHGKCANENLPKSEYGSLLKGCRGSTKCNLSFESVSGIHIDDRTDTYDKKQTKTYPEQPHRFENLAGSNAEPTPGQYKHHFSHEATQLLFISFLFFGF